MNSKPSDRLKAAEGAEPRRMTLVLVALAVVLVAVGCYYNTLSMGFVNWDDSKLIVENPYIRGLSLANLKHIWTEPIKETYLPLRATSYAVDYALWGPNPSGFHVTNVLLHAVCALLVFLIGRRLTGSPAAGFAAGALFAAHPVHTEAVAWASGRKDVLSTAFFLAAYLLYLVSIDGERRRWGVIALSLAAFVLSGLAKAMVVTLPALVMLTDFVYGGIGRGRWRRLLPVWGAYFAAAALVTLIAVHFAAKAGAIVPYHFGGRARTAAFMTWAALYYAKTMVLPDFLSARYPYGDTADFGVPNAIVYLSPVALALVLAGAAWLTVRARGGRAGEGAALTHIPLPKGEGTHEAKRSRSFTRREAGGWVKLAALGVGWFFISLLPVMNIVSINVLVADRYLYLPSVGFALGAAALLRALWGRAADPRGWTARRAIGAAALVMIAGADGARAYTRNEVWRDSVSLWTSVVREFPSSSKARLLLASAYANASPPKYDAALAEVALAEGLGGKSGEANLTRGRIYLKMGKAELAKEEFARAKALGLATVGDTYEMSLSDAEALEAGGDLRGAAAAVERAIEFDPSRAEGYVNLGRLDEQFGKLDEAQACYLKAAERDAKSAIAWYNLGRLAAQKGDAAQAAGYYNRALGADPGYAEALVNLASLRLDGGDAAGALPLLESAARLRPDLVAAHMNLSRTYAMLGDIAKAREELETVLRIDPGNAGARAILGKLDEMTKGGK